MEDKDFLSRGKIRSFIAIDIGSQKVLNEILVFQRMLIDMGANIKPVKTENIHITLRFLGEIPPSLANMISKELMSLRFKPFKVSLKEVGVFPSMRHIKVLWVGIEKGVLQIVDINSQIEAKLKSLGIRPDGRAFSPHVTIARVRSAKNKDKLEGTLLAMHDKEFGSFSVESIMLKKSVLTLKGPVYTTLTEIKARVNSLLNGS